LQLLTSAMLCVNSQIFVFFFWCRSRWVLAGIAGSCNFVLAGIAAPCNFVSTSLTRSQLLFRSFHLH
jgi:hypothetical protein